MIGDFRRTINPINVKIGSRFTRVYVKIEYKDGKLSISGVEGPLQSGNARGSCGQIDMDYRNREYRREIKFNYGWNNSKWQRLLWIWQNYHLNDLHAGTPEQEAALKKHFGGKRVDYDEEVAYLKSVGLYEQKGYKYGTGWLKQAVPENILQWLYNLEDTKNEPAWV